jgi:hypothetical protein
MHDDDKLVWENRALCVACILALVVMVLHLTGVWE